MPHKSAAHRALSVGFEEATGTRPRSHGPGTPPASCSVARRLLDTGRPEDAMASLEGDLEAGNDHAEFQFLLGRAAFRLGDHSLAQRAFGRAIALSPQDAESYRWLARLLLRRGNAAGAMRVLAWTSRTNPPVQTSQAKSARRGR